MTLKEVMIELEAMGNEGTKKVLSNHGAEEPFFGVKVADLKKIVKKVKKDHELSLQLYDTGNSDAMYLAGLIADETKITKEHLQDWVEKAYWYYLSEFTVPWIAADSGHAHELGMKWIDSDVETIASAGWACLSNAIGLAGDKSNHIKEYEILLDFIPSKIHVGENRVNYAMNGFVISVGCYIPTLTDKAYEVAKEIGKVKVNMRGTACKVPIASDYIEKVVGMGRLGKTKKMARC